MRRIFHIALCLGLLGAVTACVNDDSDFDYIINDVVDPIAIAVDSTTLSETADVVVTDVNDEAYNDYVENTNFNRTITIRYDGDEATVTGAVSGVRVTTSGAHVTVNSTSTRVHYRLMGESTNGSFKVYSEHKFRLTLAGLTLTNPTGAAINNQCGKTLYVVLADETDNTVADGPTYTDVTDEDQKGAFFSEGQVIVSGGGSLHVLATGRHGLVSDDYFRFRPGIKLYVNSASGHGIKANDGITVDGGVINVETSAAGAKAMKCDAFVTVNGGRTTLITTGDAVEETIDGVTDVTSSAAVKCDMDFTMTGGTLRMRSSGDGGKGLNTLASITMTGGTLQAVTTGTRGLGTPKGVKSTGNTTVTGGTFYTYSQRGTPLEVLGTLTVATGYSTYDTSHRQLLNIVY